MDVAQASGLASEFDVADKVLRDVLLRIVPFGRSRDFRTAVHANNYDNDLVRLILERAKLRVCENAARFYEKNVIRVPFTVDSHMEALILRTYDGIEKIISTQNKYATDYEFQTHKHYMIQHVLRLLCKLEFEPEDQTINKVYFDGFNPSDYGLVHVTNPRIYPYHITAEPEDNPAYYIVNLFDSNYSYHDIIFDLSYKRKIGAELYIIMPYDYRMTTLYSANVIEGSYSFEWVRDGTSQRKQKYFKSEKLPSSFYTRGDNVTYTLRIRPFRSNRIFTITHDDFFHMIAAGNSEGFYSETRRLSHGFAEISIIAFRPVHTINNTEFREIKKPGLPYGKRYLNNAYSDKISHEIVPNFSKSLAPPFTYIIDEKIYNRTRKAAVQIRITRNNIVPLLYHLFAYSTHIVFNGAIVSIQKVMGPELICQLTEFVLNEIMPIKLRILQAGVLIKTPTDQNYYTEFIRSAAQLMYLNTSDSNIDMESLDINTILQWIKNPELYKQILTNIGKTETFYSVPNDKFANNN